MKMKKLLALVLALLLVVTAFAGCSSAPQENFALSDNANATPAVKTAVRVCGIKGPTGVGLANLWKAQEAGTASNNYSFELVSVPQDAGTRVTSNQADIAAVPTNLAAALYKKTNGAVQMLAVNTLGVLYVLENGNTVQSVADLKGKTIYSTGEGANPEYILRHVLKENGIDPEKDVTLKFVTENEELATLVVNGTAKVALVPEPNVTTICTKNADVRVALNVTEEWDKLDAGTLMMGCVIVRKEFAEQNPDAVAAFLKDYEASINTAKSDVEGTATLCETYGIIPKAAVAKKAIPNCNLTFVAGADMQKKISGYFQVLFDANPAAIGGAMPDDAFYYVAK